MITSEQFLARWVNAVLLNHFKDQKSSAEKLFIKVSGLTEKDIRFVLDDFSNKLNVFNNYYEPIVRTVTPISGLEQFKFQNHETSTWLRNNIKSNQALVLFINEMTPEAQSLENLFAIDESYLLSKNGLKILYGLLVHEFQLTSDIDELEAFLNMVNNVAEPQLRNLLEFIVSILNDNAPSIIQKIQQYLPAFGLFRDSKLRIGNSYIGRLRNNYMLANLQKGSSLLDGERLVEKLDTFLEYEEKNQWINELWEKVTPETFRKEAIAFIRSNDKTLLKYEYEIIEAIFNFKVKQTLVERIREALSPDNREDKERIEQGLDAIVREENPDDIQDFIEEYEKELATTPLIVKSINRLIEKLRHPSEYDDLYKALLYEGFILIDENIEQVELEGASFSLKLVTTKVSEITRKLLTLYLGRFSNIVPLVHFDESTIPQEFDESVDDTAITFELSLMVNKQTLASKKFRILNFVNNSAYQIIDEIEKGNLPYVRIYSQQEVDIFNLKKFIEDKIRHYLTSGTENMEQHFERFSRFIDEYLLIAQQACSRGLCSIDGDKLDKQLTDLLSNIYSSVNIVNFIYKGLQYIGAIDALNTNKGEIGAPFERTVTVFNPIRLISYLRRMQELNRQLSEWINRAVYGELTVYKVEDYLNFITEKYSRLSPRYFVNEDEQTYLVEVSEKFGNGVFFSNTHPSSSSDYLAKELSSELVGVVKRYLEVYPYAKDGLDVLFLYCQSADVVIKSVDELFKSIPSLSKLKLTVHSTQAAQLHKALNSWIELREEYRTSNANQRFPKIEVNTISGRDVSEIASQIGSQMFDADLVVLMDYFGQNGHVKYMFQKVKPSEVQSWFIDSYKEPLSDQEAVKRIPYVSEHLPKVLQYFYQLQYIIHSKCMPSEDELHLLNVTVSASFSRDEALIDFMHDQFNWVMIMDRFLDKSLLQKASSKAQIIQYKSKAGKNKNFKLILSSSEYVRKLSNYAQDHAYYDRLYKRLSNILKNNSICRDIIIQAVNKVKDISGALVLKVIGPGKYAHEMLATCLSVDRRKNTEAVLQVWSVCDELPWFVSNKRRPDLVSTTISRQDGRIVIDFELIELKFVSHHILDRERMDAVKQIEVGLNEYRNRFSFEESCADSAYWKDELVHYLIEKQAYSPQQVKILKELQQVSPRDIVANLSGAVDVYCYTSNLIDRTWNQIADGVYEELLGDSYRNYIYSRHYILKQLGTDEDLVPDYEELNEDARLGDIPRETKSEDKNVSVVVEEDEQNVKPYFDIEKTTMTNINNGQSGKEQSGNEIMETEDHSQPITVNADSAYPEVEALKGVELSYQLPHEDHTELRSELERLLVRNFLKNGLNIKIKESIVGSSVIRFYLDVPSDVTTKKITSRSKDIQVWLRLNNEPTFAIDNRGMHMDIVRENPDTIYFEHFMRLVREQLNAKINNTNLIAPLGLDPLNNVVSIDLSDSTTPHLLVGGTTGSGKSVTLNSIILGIMCLYSFDDVQFVFIDPKQVEFNFYEDKAHTMKVITQVEEAVETLEQLVHEMDQRYSTMNKEYVSNLEEFIKITGEKIPRIVVVFDEFADFMNQDKEIAKRVETAIQRLGQKARAAGIHLIICTQYPKAEIINTKIRANLPGRLALKAADAVASHVILDQEGAERLAGKGDFLAKTTGNPIRGKSPFLTTEVKRALLKYFEKKAVKASR